MSNKTRATSDATESPLPLKAASTEWFTVPSVPPNPPANDVNAYLKDQAAKLKNLEAKGNRLKLDFVQNARDKGELLLETQKAVSTIPGRFHVWVVNDTDMGYSTALLWIEFVVNWEDA